MRANIKFVIEGIDLSMAFDCTSEVAYEIHNYLINRASKSSEAAKLSGVDAVVNPQQAKPEKCLICGLTKVNGVCNTVLCSNRGK